MTGLITSAAMVVLSVDPSAPTTEPRFVKVERPRRRGRAAEVRWVEVYPDRQARPVPANVEPDDVADTPGVNSSGGPESTGSPFFRSLPGKCPGIRTNPDRRDHE